MHNLPVDLANFKIAYPVGGEIGNFDLYRIDAFLEVPSHASPHRQCEKSGSVLAVDSDSGGFSHITEVEHIIVGACMTGQIKSQTVTCCTLVVLD